MKTLRLMDATGDTAISFEDGTKESDEAKALFERLTAKGAAVFAVNRGGDMRVKNFNDLEAENVIVPLIVGG